MCEKRALNSYAASEIEIDPLLNRGPDHGASRSHGYGLPGSSWHSAYAVLWDIGKMQDSLVECNGILPSDNDRRWLRKD
jgi:hypothetical protein